MVNDFILFLYKLRVGNFGLGKTVWLYLVGSWFAELFFSLLLILMNLSSCAQIFHLFYIVVYFPNAVIGVWHAADKYTGPKIFALIARIIVGIIVLFYLYTIYFIVMIESSMLANSIHQNLFN